MKPEDHTTQLPHSPETTNVSELQSVAPNEEAYQPASLAAAPAAVTAQVSPAPAPATHQHANDDAAAKVGRWAYRNQDFFNSPSGWFSVKQVARSLVASAAMMVTAIPVLTAFEWANSYADKIKGAIKDKDFSKVAKTATLAEEEIAKLDKRADLIKMFAGPEKPYKPILYVAAGFSMYRGTTKIFNKLYEKLFNPKNDEQKTIEEVRHIPDTLKDAVKEVAPAEFQSTPFAAVALGGLRSVFPAGSIQKEYTLPTRADIKEMGAFSPTWKQRAKNVLTTVGHHPGKDGKIASAFLGLEVPLNLLGYFTFFELGDRLFKDVQLRRGYWKGDANTTNGLWRGNTTNLPQTAGDAITQNGNGILAAANVEQAQNGKKILLTTYEENGPHGSITNDPSAGRLLLRSAPPVAAGITAYLGLHKLVKLTLGTLEPVEYGAGFKKNAAKFAHNFKVEWAAIGMFFAYAMSKELWENWYDKHIVGQRKIEPSQPQAETRTAAVSPTVVPATVTGAVYSPLSEKVEPGVKPGSHGEKGEGTAKPETRISSVVAHEAGHGHDHAPQMG